MPYRIPNEGPIPEGLLRRLEPISIEHGVTVDRIVQVVRARRKFRRAAQERKRSRKGQMKKNLFARSKHAKDSEAMYSGEAEFHAHLRALGLTPAEFCALVGITRRTFYRWYGHPLHAWPIEFLRWYGYAKGMEKKLCDLGWDTEQFRPKLPTRLRSEGRYPRKAGDLEIGEKPLVDWSPWDSNSAS